MNEISGSLFGVNGVGTQMKMTSAVGQTRWLAAGLKHPTADAFGNDAVVEIADVILPTLKERNFLGVLVKAERSNAFARKLDGKRQSDIPKTEDANGQCSLLDPFSKVLCPMRTAVCHCPWAG